jgi:putative ABC transport system permease protein
VISYAFWQREFAGDPSVIGREFTLNFRRVEVIGVTAAGFSGLEIGRSYDVAVPICSQAVLWNAGNWLDEGTVWWLNVMGRLKRGQTLRQVSAQLGAMSAGIFRATLPANYPTLNVKDYLEFRLAAVPAGNGVSTVRKQYSDPLILLLATAGLVLLIACANLANLMLARNTAREHEIAVRLAIGATRGRLVRQLMTESILLTAAGSALGIFLSGAVSQLMVALIGTEGDPLFLDLAPDAKVLAFMTALATLTCILFGLTPAWRATGTGPGEMIKKSGRNLTTSREGFGLRQLLVVSQVALSLVLLVSALLFSGSLRNLLAVDAGFQHNGILIADIDLSRLQVPSERRVAFKHGLLEKIRTLPGAASAAEAGILPLSGSGTDNNVWLEGSDPNRKLVSNFTWVGEGYLKTMAVPLLVGRDFSDRDTVRSARVAIVNEALALRLRLPGNPVGQKFRREATPSEPERVFEIIGLVKNTKYHSLREEFGPIAFLSSAQDAEPSPFTQIVIRSTVPLRDMSAEVKSAVAAVSPQLGLSLRVFETMVEEGLLRERLMAMLSSFFGLLAALIAAVGLYGVMSYLVVRRTNEIGIRMALGADQRSIFRLVLGEAAVLLTAGLACGALLALMIARTVESLLFGLKPQDAGTLGVAAALLAAVTLAAGYIPARRSARLDPMAALREE